MWAGEVMAVDTHWLLAGALILGAAGFCIGDHSCHARHRAGWDGIFTLGLVTTAFISGAALSHSGHKYLIILTGWWHRAQSFITDTLVLLTAVAFSGL